MKIRNAAALVLALVTVTALAACGGGPGSAPSPTASSSPTSTPPTPEVPVAASVTISAASITVLDADGGALASFDYFQPTEEVVTGLTEHLGAPVDSPNPGSIESPPGVDHVWGGLRLYDTDIPGVEPETPNHYVFVTEAMTGSVPISTEAGIGSAEGVAVGDPATSVTVGVEPGSSFTDPTTGRTSEVVRIGIVELPPRPDLPEPRNFAVMVVSFTDTGLVERLVAPSANFGV